MHRATSRQLNRCANGQRISIDSEGAAEPRSIHKFGGIQLLLETPRVARLAENISCACRRSKCAVAFDTHDNRAVLDRDRTRRPIWAVRVRRVQLLRERPILRLSCKN